MTFDLERIEEAARAEQYGISGDLGVLEMEPHVVLALVEVVKAARGLVEDTEKGGSQKLRAKDCGDAGCGYDTCRLARALGAFGDEQGSSSGGETA